MTNPNHCQKSLKYFIFKLKKSISEKSAGFPLGENGVYLVFSTGADKRHVLQGYNPHTSDNLSRGRHKEALQRLRGRTLMVSG
jgi:hypothetical protein